jgi:plasmid stabilization system protein ParE
VSLRIHLADAAERDVADHYVYIGLDSPDAAERFLIRAWETFQLLAATPRAGRPWRSPHGELKGMRVWRVSGFPRVLVFYRVGRGVLDVKRLLHGARDTERELRRS